MVDKKETQQSIDLVAAANSPYSDDKDDTAQQKEQKYTARKNIVKAMMASRKEWPEKTQKLLDQGYLNPDDYSKLAGHWSEMKQIELGSQVQFSSVWQLMTKSEEKNQQNAYPMALLGKLNKKAYSDDEIKAIFKDKMLTKYSEYIPKLQQEMDDVQSQQGKYAGKSDIRSTMSGDQGKKKTKQKTKEDILPVTTQKGPASIVSKETTTSKPSLLARATNFLGWGQKPVEEVKEEVDINISDLNKELEEQSAKDKQKVKLGNLLPTTEVKPVVKPVVKQKLLETLRPPTEEVKQQPQPTQIPQPTQQSRQMQQYFNPATQPQFQQLQLAFYEHSLKLKIGLFDPIEKYLLQRKDFNEQQKNQYRIREGEKQIMESMNGSNRQNTETQLRMIGESMMRQNEQGFQQKRLMSDNNIQVQSTQGSGHQLNSQQSVSVRQTTQIDPDDNLGLDQEEIVHQEHSWTGAQDKIKMLRKEINKSETTEEQKREISGQIKIITQTIQQERSTRRESQYPQYPVIQNSGDSMNSIVAQRSNTPAVLNVTDQYEPSLEEYLTKWGLEFGQKHPQLVQQIQPAQAQFVRQNATNSSYMLENAKLKDFAGIFDDDGPDARMLHLIERGKALEKQANLKETPKQKRERLQESGRISDELYRLQEANAKQVVDAKKQPSFVLPKIVLDQDVYDALSPQQQNAYHSTAQQIITQEKYMNYMAKLIPLCEKLQGSLGEGSLAKYMNKTTVFTEKIKKKESVNFQISPGSAFKLRQCC